MNMILRAGLSLGLVLAGDAATAQQVICGMERFCSSGEECTEFNAPRPFDLTFNADGSVTGAAADGGARMELVAELDGTRSFAAFDQKDSVALLTIRPDGTLDLTAHDLTGRKPVFTASGRCELPR